MRHRTLVAKNVFWQSRASSRPHAGRHNVNFANSLCQSFAIDSLLTLCLHSCRGFLYDLPTQLLGPCPYDADSDIASSIRHEAPFQCRMLNSSVFGACPIPVPSPSLPLCRPYISSAPSWSSKVWLRFDESKFLLPRVGALFLITPSFFSILPLVLQCHHRRSRRLL